MAKAPNGSSVSIQDPPVLEMSSSSVSTLDPRGAPLRAARALSASWLSDGSAPSSTDVFFQRFRDRRIDTSCFVPDLAHRCIVSTGDTVDAKTFTTWRGYAAMLFVDISGYSKLATALAPKGPHALGAAVEGYFDKIVSVILEHRGDVLKFAGDAVIVAWHEASRSLNVDDDAAAFGEDHDDDGLNGMTAAEAEAAQTKAAVRCAGALNETCGEYHPPGHTGNVLRLHMGITYGELSATVLSRPSADDVMARCFFVMSGPALTEVSHIAATAPTGDVWLPEHLQKYANACGFRCTLVDTATAHHALPSCVKVTKADDDNNTAPAQSTNSNPIAEPSKPMEDAATTATSNVDPAEDDQVNASDGTAFKGQGPDDFIPKTTFRYPECDSLFVAPKLLKAMNHGVRLTDATELRQLVVFFIGTTTEGMLEEWVTEAREVLSSFGCPITQVIDDDKGEHIIAALNLFDAKENAADVAASIIRALASRNLGAVMGVAAGTVYCCSIGNASQCRWDITGAACVRACRLMEYAKANLSATEYAIDQSVVDLMKDRSALRLVQDKVELKGSAEPVPVFGLLPESIDQRLEVPIATIAALGEGEYASDVHHSTIAQIRRHCSAFVFHGNEMDSPVRSASPGAGANKQSSCILIRGAQQSGKKFVALVALAATRFVPILIRVGTAGNSIPATLASWLACLEDVELAQLGVDAVHALAMGQSTHGYSLTLQAMQKAVEKGFHIAIVLDSAQNLTVITLRFVALLVSRSHKFSREGRLMIFFTLTPREGGCTPSQIVASLQMPNMPVFNLMRETDEAEGHRQMRSLLAHFRDFSKYGITLTDPYPAKAQYMPGITCVIAKRGSQHTIPNFIQVLKGIAPPSTLLAGFDLKKGTVDTEKLAVFVEEAKWSFFAPQLMMNTTPLLDAVNPQQLLVLKVIAATTTELVSFPLNIVTELVKTLLEDASLTEIMQHVHTLRSLLLLEFSEEDFSSPMAACRFHIALVREQILTLLTPKQLITVSGRAAVAYEAYLTQHKPKDSVKEAVFRRHLARLYGQAGSKRLCRTTAAVAWKACRTLEDRKTAQWEEHRLAQTLLEFNVPFVDPEITKQHEGEMSFDAGPQVQEFAGASDNFKFRDFKIFFSKWVDPHVALGPLCGYTALTGRRIFEVASRQPMHPHTAAVTFEEYMATVEAFESVLLADDVSQSPDYIAYLAKEADVMRAVLDSNTTTDAMVDLSDQFLDVLGDSKLLTRRYERLMRFISMTEIPADAKQRADERSEAILANESHSVRVEYKARVTALEAAFKHLSEVYPDPPEHERQAHADKTRRALLALSVHRWSTEHPYLTVTRLREYWLDRLINPAHIKAVVFTFRITAHASILPAVMRQEKRVQAGAL